MRFKCFRKHVHLVCLQNNTVPLLFRLFKYIIPWFQISQGPSGFSKIKARLGCHSLVRSTRGRDCRLVFLRNKQYPTVNRSPQQTDVQTFRCATDGHIIHLYGHARWEYYDFMYGVDMRSESSIGDSDVPNLMIVHSYYLIYKGKQILKWFTTDRTSKSFSINCIFHRLKLVHFFLKPLSLRKIYRHSDFF